MVDSLRKRRTDLPERDRVSPASATTADGAGAADGLVRSLQQGAGNAAVASLLGGRVQRAPLKADDRLMDPSTGELVPGSEPDVRPNEAATAAPTTAPSPAAPAPTPASAEDPSAGEATKFEEDVIGQVISLYAVLRDPAPDFELAAAKFKPIGQSLFDLQMKYEATNPDLANLIMAVRGWMSRPYDAILARTGGLKPMRDSDIAARVSDLIPDLRAIGDRLR